MAAPNSNAANATNNRNRLDNRGKPSFGTPAIPEFSDKVVHINRVSKVVKGGSRYSLSVLVVVGDEHGKVGVGMGKSKETPFAIAKATEKAKRDLFNVPITKDGSIPHEVIGEYGSARVLLKPATPGTGVIAGGSARALLELAGLTNVLSKSLGSDNAVNVVKATADGLRRLNSPADVARKRGLPVAKLFGYAKKVETDTHKGDVPGKSDTDINDQVKGSTDVQN